MFRLIVIALVVPLLFSCAETYTDLPRQYIGKDFKRISLTNRIGAHKGVKVRYYIKTFDEDGYLAICGAYLSEGGIAEAFGEWVSRASVSIGSRKNIVAPARFMGEVHRSGGDRSARCVKTDLKANSYLLNARARLVGSSVRMY